ncbi:pyridoxal 5'-phosphate synthase glutaminase subunit PdxT [Sulfobacillus thermosulfidooxidans]|uniref:pyridoxal 5'-phosphate synthase glutaminase subunit PdxT n=1 Tax=Sulfobacillus thermosulfidooxidans TaxID=28034 RepID=UPI0003F4E40C|nr:pyridoxal 5'-phosphate synthase glutaminase subunit PdxT [Sulfobacillus thermosulfidooxidans]
MTLNIGVLAIQGDVREHKNHLAKVGANPVEVRTLSDLEKVQGLIIPGGESTTIGMLMAEEGLIDAIRKRVTEEQFPVYGTCAGLILLAKEVIGPSPARLGLMDITADRNAYGRQLASFETKIPIKILAESPEFPAVFIRAPQIRQYGPQVIPLATYDGQVVMAEEGPLLVSAFHPEMSGDVRIHEYFVNKVRKTLNV